MTMQTNLTLTGEQKLVLALPLREPVLVRGAAGSGKTTVAVYRARHLYESHHDLFRSGRIGLFTYTNALVNYVRTMLPSLPFVVSTLHKQAMAIIRAAPAMGRVHPAASNDLRAHLAAALEETRAQHGGDRALLNKDMEFYSREVAWIKGRCISSLADYRAPPRIGRGTADRVTDDDRAPLWNLCESYNRRLKACGVCDWDDVILKALRIASRPGFTTPFTHIVIDEAQDCTFAQLSLIARLVSPETNSITLVGDAAQRIYQSGFSWNDTGIRVAGARSREFRMNYRNTHEIAAAACSLLSHEEDRAEFTETVIRERSGESASGTRNSGRA